MDWLSDNHVSHFYVSSYLDSEETMFDALSKQINKCSGLILVYADKNWRSEVDSILQKHNSNNTSSEWKNIFENHR